MKVLVLGANGMLGHKVFQALGKTLEVDGAIRGTYSIVAGSDIFPPARIIPEVDAMKIETVEKAIDKSRPEAIVNCIGIVKAMADQSGAEVITRLNALFPHQLYRLCQPRGIRLIHISTDCVFSGRKGDYKEEDPSDAEDVYGKTKFLGEVTGPGALTVRTSFIGRELTGSNGLLEWFIAQEGKTVDGWTNAVFSGFTTLHLAGIIRDIIEKHRDLTGLYHVSSQPVSKYELLVLINKAMKLNIKINKSPEPRLDRSLDSSRFRAKTGFRPLPWGKMAEEMAEDARQYAAWR